MSLRWQKWLCARIAFYKKKKSRQELSNRYIVDYAYPVGRIDL